jgi:putative nucleotidyltransferase with HDIG domain
MMQQRTRTNSDTSANRIAFLCEKAFFSQPIRKSLTSRGAIVVPCSHDAGKHGGFRPQTCDILVMDTEFVGSGWKDVIDDLKASNAGISVFVITDPETAADAAETLCDVHSNICTKPLDEHEFTTCIETLLREVRIRSLNGKYFQRVERMKEEFTARKHDLQDGLQRFRNDLEKQMHELKLSASNTIDNIVQVLEHKDPCTLGHSLRVKLIARDLGHRMGLSDGYVDILEKAGLYHDIGKIYFSGEMLYKQYSLSAEEREKIKAHPLLGTKILSPFPHLAPVIPLVQHHHERMDGTGYPEGLKEDELTILEKIIIAADAYDAMVSDRPYRRALSKDEVLQELKGNTSSQFSIEVVTVLTEYCEEKG